MPEQPLPSAEDLLRPLPVCITAIEHLLDAQPDLATVMATQLRQALATLVPANPPNPDTVFLNEYVYDTPSKAAQDGSARVPRITRTRSLTQLLQEAIVSHKVATQAAKEPPTGLVDQAVGFYAQAYHAGRDGEIAALEVAAVNTLIDDLQHDSLSLYAQALAAFWSAPHASTGALSVLDAVSQQQRVMFALEADLKLHEARQQLTQAEQVVQSKPADAQAQTALAKANTDLKVLTEGRQLIENRLLHETSNNAMPPQTLSISLYSPNLPGWSTPLNGCFVLTERLHGLRPAVLYTPQFGVEIFEHFYAMENVMCRRLVSGPEKTLLLANIVQSERSGASETLRGGQHLRYTPITGPVFRACLQGQRDQQEADIEQAFSASYSTFDALATAVSASLALPLKGSPNVSARLPKLLDPVRLPAHSPPDPEQQAQLIHLWNSLNQQLNDVLDKRKHPSLDAVLTPLLKQTFPHLATETEPAGLYVNRYRTDSDGLRHFESSRTLRESLGALLLWEDDAAPTDNGVTFTEGVFCSPSAVSETEQIEQNGTLLALAESLQAGLAAQVSTYWQTPIAPEMACPQARLIDVHRQALDVQARLRVADNTLSPQAKWLIDCALHWPTQARREACFGHGSRPGVYQLTLNTGSAAGARLAGSFVLTASDGSSPVLPHWPYAHKNLSTQSNGGAMAVLYTPGEGFEEFATLRTLHDTLTVRINAGDDAGKLLASGLPLSVQHTKSGLWGSDLRSTFAPIQDDFVANSIQALLDKQQADIQAILGLTEGEPDGESNGRVELVELLDMAAAFITRNQRLLEHWRPDWQKRLSPTDQKALQDQAQIAREKQDELGKQWNALIPTLAEYAKQQVLLKIRAFLAEKGSDDKTRADYPAQGIDPDRTKVVSTTKTRISAGAGFQSVHESVVPSQMSLTNLLLRNTKPWDKSLSWSQDEQVEATLINGQGGWVKDAHGKAITVDKERLELWVKDLNVGHAYTENVLKKYLAPQATEAAAQALQKAWIASQASALEYAALSARLSPDAYSTALASDNNQNKAAAWMAAVLASTDPATRQPVDGQAVLANALMFNPASDAPEGRGGQTVNGVLILCTAVNKMRVLYAPHAPDGLELREVASEAELIRLMGSSAWQAYLQERLPAATRLLNHRLVVHPGDVLAGLYRQNYLHLLDKTDTESVTNEELNAQSTFNKVMFGVEVVTTVLGGFPWGGKLASSAFGWVGRMTRTSVQALRNVGQSVAGLIVRRGVAGRVLFEVATASGTARAAGVGITPLSILLKPVKRTPLPDLTGYQRAFQQESASLAIKGGIPAGSSLAEGTGIYRTPGSPSTLLVRSSSETGKEQVFRIQDAFNRYDPNGLVAPVLTPSGGWTRFRLRPLPNQLWALDTLQRTPGGAPNAANALEKALREWEAHVAANAQLPAPLPLDCSVFFSERNIPLKTWNKYVTQAGHINARGQWRLNPGSYGELTDSLFKAWLRLGDETPQAANTFLQTHRLSPAVWWKYIAHNGTLKQAGLIRSLRLGLRPSGGRGKITDQHILDWDRLYLRPQTPRATPITKMDVANYALDNDIHLDSWRKYVSTTGSFLRSNPSIAARLDRLGIARTPVQTAPVDLAIAGPSQPPA